jgi:hypothetical protein
LSKTHKALKKKKFDLSKLKSHMRWLALTAEIVWESNWNGDNASFKRHVDRVVDNWVDVLGKFTNNGQTAAFQQEIRNIVEKTVYFGHLASCGMAIIHRSFYVASYNGRVTYGFKPKQEMKLKFEAYKVDDDAFATQELNETVEITIKPYLARIGNYAGDGYENAVILSKGTTVGHKGRQIRERTKD